MNKVNAPSLLLEDFNYLFNKAINQYVNKRYNYYDVNQQTTDDLRVLKATAILPAKKAEIYEANSGNVISENSLYGAVYEVYLPLDYLHILNCICNFKVKRQIKCYDEDTYVQFGAFRLTSDIWSKIINNFYMRPSYKKPYYFIHNVNTVNDGSVPTNPYNEDNMLSTGFGTGTDIPIQGTLSDSLNKYLQEQGLTRGTNVSITKTSYENETLNLIEEKYVTGTDSNGVVWCIVWDAKKNAFSKFKDSNTNIYVNSNLLTVTTTNDEIKAIDEVLYINGDKITTDYLLITDDLLERYGHTYLFGGLPRVIKTKHGNIDLIEKDGIHRYGNASNIRMEIRYGKDDSIFKLENVYVDYIKTPQHIRLTQEQLDLTEDTSQVMEFPDYVCQEIINELTHLLMENASDQRISTHPTVVQSIAAPAQAQTQTT